MQAFLVPQRAVRREADVRLTALVAKDGEAASVTLERDGTEGGAWIVNWGLSNGDRVIVG